jgi:3'-5' exoribonuclease
MTTDSLDRLEAFLENDPRFNLWPSSIDKHHSWEGGNRDHTYQVTSLASHTGLLAQYTGAKIDQEVLQAAALMHDYGKIDTYEKVDGVWRKVANYTKSMHIERSIHHARLILPELGFTEGVLGHVGRIVDCIGSHHGRLEWGALWEPRTPEAWLLHLADMASAMTMGGGPARTITP